MNSRTRVRLFSLLLLFGVLAGILATPASQTAQASVCCETCQLIAEWCMAGQIYPSCHRDPYCCADKVGECDQTCYWC